jgi:hypothetical protein
MMDVAEDLGERIKAVIGAWPSYAALGSFLLYLLGYLSLRFHLTAFGVGTDLSILDERYLFAGAKFLVYIFTIVPMVIVLAAVLAALVLAVATLIYLPYRALSPRTRKKTTSFINWERGKTFLRSLSANTLSILGIVLSLLLIQLVMRQCFHFSNLLLADGLHEPDWVGALFADQGYGPLRSILLNEGGSLPEVLYFSVLVAGVAITGMLLFAAWRRVKETTTASTGAARFPAKLLPALLVFLVAVQILLLPVNYGVLIMDKVLPRVADLGGQEQLSASQAAWLVWEGHDGVTYLVRSTEPTGNHRKLVTLPRKDMKRMEIVRYDPILRCVFVDQGCP